MPTYQEPARETPIVEGADVVVCGGGPAGWAAAIAAARAGARTRLLEAQGCLGGMWTAGLVSWVIEGGNKTGIMRELNQRLEARGARYGQARDYAYDPEAMKLTLEEMAREAGVEAQLYTRTVGAAVESGRLRYALTESPSGRQAWAAGAFVDATGNGDLAAAAGCGYDVGREGSGEMQPLSLLGLIAGPDAEEIHDFICWPGEPHEQAKRALLDEMHRAGVSPSYAAPTIMHLGGYLYVISTNHEYGRSGLDAADLTAATLAARAELHRLIGGLRAVGGPWRALRLVATGSHIGIRDGRRIRGLYQVNRDDLLTGATHADAICRVTVGIDVHSTDPAAAKSYSAENRTRTLPYDIPLRALVARDAQGLLLAGRCISGDFLAHASYRMTGTAATLGQAAGVCAALAATSNRLPHQVAYGEVRAALAAQGSQD